MGAYVRTNGGVVPAKAAQFLPGPYRIPHVACEVLALMTTKTPIGTYRGPGRFEANFFRERLIDLMAADLGLDPADVRLRNLLTPAELPFQIGTLVPYEAPGEYDTGDYPSALRHALAAIDYPRLAGTSGRVVDGRRHGVGIGCFVESSGAGPTETARIVVRRAGCVELYTGCASSGQGLETWMAQILADALGIPFDWIRVFHGTTSFVDEGHGTYHSRAVAVGGSAITVAAAELIARGSPRMSWSGGGGPCIGAAGRLAGPCWISARSPPRARPRRRRRSRRWGGSDPRSSRSPTARTSRTWRWTSRRVTSRSCGS
jgi:aerobic carbon-monoxide dehydrogenase large subunit